MKRIIVDTGVWYACFDKTDDNHHCYKKILHVLNSSEIIIPIHKKRILLPTTNIKQRLYAWFFKKLQKAKDIALSI